MATLRQGNQSLWVADFLNTLIGPLDVDRFQAVFEARPRKIQEREDAGREFLVRAGPQLVLGFLRKVRDTKDTNIKQCKYHVYNVLLRLTCPGPGEVRYKVTAEMVHQGILQQVAADISSHVQTCRVNVYSFNLIILN